MKSTLRFLILFLIISFQVWAAPDELKEKLQSLNELTKIETLQSDHYSEKYLVRITQPVDHKNPDAGTFTQRVVVSHVGFDRPTVIVTEGYGGAYALNPRYQDELSRLFNTNVVFVEHRYFLESTPEPLNWDYLTAENSAYDLHHVTNLFKTIYSGKWISTGISKGGQTTMIYRSYFPEDVDFSVPYVAPLNRSVEDQRQEEFMRKVGTKKERKLIQNFQKEILKRKASMLPLLESYSNEKKYTYPISLPEVLDYCVLEYAFSMWQWGTSINYIPSLKSDDKVLFNHLVDISNPDYFTKDQPTSSFFVQAARELGYYGYDLEPFKKYLTITSAEGYLQRIMLPTGVSNIQFSTDLYHKVYNYLKENDPKMIFIYGEIDPWSATRAPSFEGKRNEQIYIQPRGSHRARISNMPDDMKGKIIAQINEWLAE